MLYDKIFIKDPDDVLDYSRDWSSTLADNETITGSQWIVPSGIVEDSASIDGSLTTVWLSSGTAGVDYDITNRITTDQGRTIDRTFRIKVRER